MLLTTLKRSFNRFVGRNTSYSTVSADAFLKGRKFLLDNRQQYDKAYQDFRWPQLGQEFNWGKDYFDLMAENNHNTALWLVGEKVEQKISFEDMRRRSNQMANFLVHRGVKPFDKILLMLPNVAPLWECTLAAIKLPAVMIPTSTLLTTEEIADRIKRANIQHVITSSEEIHKLAHLPINKILVDKEEHFYHSEIYQPLVQSKATDPLFHYFTSGTTSKPKLVTHTHQSYPVGHLSTMFWLGLGEQDVHLNISTAGWAKHAWSSFFAPWNAGATIMAYAYPRFDIDTLLDMLVQYPITSLCAPPTVWRLLRQKSLNDYPVSLRQGLSAGEPLNPEVSADIEKAWKIIIREGYGQTETTALIAYCLGQNVTRGAMGSPLPGYRLKIIDEKGNAANEGQLAVECNPDKPIGVMEGYSDSWKTNEVMQGGVYRTGDRVRRENGLLFFVGRDDDVFKCNGYRISPFELESILLEHPAVLEAAVVPKPDAIKGNVPKAFIVLRGKYDHTIINDIDSFQKKKIAPSHRILAIEICDTLPKTSSGKIIRAELRAREKAIYEQNENNANKTYTR